MADVTARHLDLDGGELTVWTSRSAPHGGWTEPTADRYGHGDHEGGVREPEFHNGTSIQKALEDIAALTGLPVN
ncbi:hypothetical protein [Gordonia oryzae]|uniref:hypothetical protein n=1 Tax=Gordonia oryzae TaxID=2487349 RepID=UPI0016071B8B|nr:hypothetical protein [Gordonia oryzae]